MRLLGTLGGLNKETDVLIGIILSWASIVDLSKILLLNTYFSRRAKRCKQWKKLLRTVPIPSFHMCEDCETEFFNCHHQASFDDPRISRLFTDLNPYKRCMKLMPVAQNYVKNLLSFYNLKRHPLGFEYKYEQWYNENRGDFEMFGSNDAAAQHIVRMETRYPKRWILLHNIISLHMAACERVHEFEPHYFLDAFCGDGMDPNTGSSFREWYQSFILIEDEGDEFMGSDEHLRSLVCETQEEWEDMATLFGNLDLADTFDILSIVRAKLEVLLLKYPGPSGHDDDDDDDDDDDFA